MTTAPRPLRAASVHDRRGARSGTDPDQHQGRNTVSSINRTRRNAYRVARILGDVQAVRSGRIGRRVARRVAGRMTGQALGRAFR
jgi:hypothetical protein